MVDLSKLAFAIENVVWPGRGVVAYYTAATAGKAKAKAARALADVGVPGSEWKGLRCRRAPEFDGLTLVGADPAHAEKLAAAHEANLLGGETT